MAIIGTALIIAINPLELRKRARDNVRFQDAKTLQLAVLRFYSGENCYPWQKQSTNACNQTRTLSPGYLSAASFSVDNYNFSSLITQQELKNGFARLSSVSNSELYVSQDSTTGRFSVCFTPESKQGREGGMGKLRDRTNLSAGSCDNSYARDESNCNVCVPQL